MIVTISGNVKYQITLDPTVWIFDDRKVLFDTLFSEPNPTYEQEEKEIEEKLTDEERYSQRVKPPVNKSINRFEREQILKNSYAMALAHFIAHAEISKDATSVILETTNGPVEVPLSKIKTCYLLFAVDGKPVQEDGPVHVYFEDGSNKESPITGVQKIVVQ